VIECPDPKACMTLLHGATKDVLAEMFRNMNDGLNLLNLPSLVLGGGVVSVHSRKRVAGLNSVEKMAYAAVAVAFEVIPRTIIQKCGEPPMKVLTQFRVTHAAAPQERKARSASTDSWVQSPT
jgi:T-complex protein 1 subunit gamma